MSHQFENTENTNKKNLQNQDILKIPMGNFSTQQKKRPSYLHTLLNRIRID